MSSAQQHNPDLAAASRYFSACLGQPFIPGNHITTLRNGDAIFSAMLAAIDQAQESIEFLTFVYWQGDIAIQFAQRLADAAGRGVAVRVMLDSFGALNIEPRARKLLEQHCQLRWFRPLHTVRFWHNFKRTHRKIMVCDGTLGFTGGVGIAQQWSGNADSPDNWRETHFSVRGPAVTAIRAAFAENWLEADPRDTELLDDLARRRQPQAGDEALMTVASTASNYWSTMGTLLLTAIAAAHKSLHITTPYFVPDDNLQQLLIDARQRGVNVEIFIPAAARSDSKLAALAAEGCLAKLIDANIKIYYYQPTLIHTKCIIIDRQTAIIGSVNFNQRSQRKDDEIALVLDQGGTLQELLQDFYTDLESAQQITPATLKKRSQLLVSAAQLVQPFRRSL